VKLSELMASDQYDVNTIIRHIGGGIFEVSVSVVRQTTAEEHNRLGTMMVTYSDKPTQVVYREWLRSLSEPVHLKAVFEIDLGDTEIKLLPIEIPSSSGDI
jgi:hypothetical protein